MQAMTATDMRAVVGGAHYAYCPVCHAKKEVKWSLFVLFHGWNTAISALEANLTNDHAFKAATGRPFRYH